MAKELDKTPEGKKIIQEFKVRPIETTPKDKVTMEKTPTELAPKTKVTPDEKGVQH